MSTFLGADTAQMQTTADSISRTMQAMSSLVLPVLEASTHLVWTGPDAEEFFERAAETARGVERLIEVLLRERHEQLERQREEQERCSEGGHPGFDPSILPRGIVRDVAGRSILTAGRVVEQTREAIERVVESGATGGPLRLPLPGAPASPPPLPPEQEQYEGWRLREENRAEGEQLRHDLTRAIPKAGPVADTTIEMLDYPGSRLSASVEARDRDYGNVSQLIDDLGTAAEKGDPLYAARAVEDASIRGMSNSAGAVLSQYSPGSIFLTPSAHIAAANWAGEGALDLADPLLSPEQREMAEDMLETSQGIEERVRGIEDGSYTGQVLSDARRRYAPMPWDDLPEE